MWPKGVQRGFKSGGRQKGVPNRRTFDLVDELEKHGVDPVGKISSLIPLLEPFQQAKILLGLLDYIYPKRKTTDFSSVDTEEVDKKIAEEMTSQLKAIHEKEIESAYRRGCEDEKKANSSLCPDTIKKI